MLVSLLNIPKNPEDWNVFFFANRDINTNIRQKIKDTTGNIIAVVITSYGSGYTSAPVVTITDLNGTGQGASAIATYTVSGGFYSFPVTVLTEGAGYVNPVISFSGGGGAGATAVAQFKPVVNLTEYILYPYDESNKEDFQTFLENNSQAHDDFNSELGLQSSDIEELDPKDQNKLQEWIYQNYKEVESACQALKI